jgi:hypothetical protein
MLSSKENIKQIRSKIDPGAIPAFYIEAVEPLHGHFQTLRHISSETDPETSLGDRLAD